MTVANRQQRETSQQITIKSLIDLQEANNNTVNVINNALSNNNYGLEATKITIDNIYEIAKALNKTDDNSIRTRKQEFKSTLEQMTKDYAKEYGIKRNNRSMQAKNIFTKIWKIINKEKDFKFEMNLETMSLLEELISNELAKLKRINPHLFEDFYEMHDLDIVKNLYNDILEIIEDKVKLQNKVKEYELENKRLNNMIDEMKKENNKYLTEVRNSFIEMANPYLEKYFG